MKEFLRFMAGNAGRWIRGMMGFALLAWGYNYNGGINITLITIGLVPLATAAFDICLLAPVLGYPLKGKYIRERFEATGEPADL